MKCILYMAVMSLVMLNSCTEFLDKKPDIKLVIPKSLNDANLLLNDYGTLNSNYPTFGEMGNDDFYLTKQRWDAISNYEQRMAFVWADEPYTDAIQWQRPNKVVYIANQVLEILSKIDRSQQETDFKRIWGGAHFYRAFAWHQLVGVYCPAYQAATSANDLGIPLRQNPGIDEKSVRASLKETYGHIISNFKIALSNLPLIEPTKGRPSKASAYGALARVYLDMGEFDLAYRYADSCLQLKPDLLDFNKLSASSNNPLTRFNVEVLFPALATGATPMAATTALMDTLLVNSYVAGDLRKAIFFKTNSNPVGSYYYKGSFDQSATLFFGITTSEVYLIKAEAASRIGKIGEAQTAINSLIKSRWSTSVPYIAITESDPEKLLRTILTERRKELVFRGRRWSDLKRLNLDSRFQITLKRVFGDQTYTLPPNDPRYAYRISETVLELSGIQQNRR